MVFFDLFFLLLYALHCHEELAIEPEDDLRGYVPLSSLDFGGIGIELIDIVESIFEGIFWDALMLIDEDHVGVLRLELGRVALVFVAGKVLGIDYRDDAIHIEPVILPDFPDDRGWRGRTGSFNDDPVRIREEQFLESLLQLPDEHMADAALEHLFGRSHVSLLSEEGIDLGVAELIFEPRDPVFFRQIFDEIEDERRFPSPEETGDDRDRNSPLIGDFWLRQ